MPTRNIALPPVHNARAPEQWRITSEHVDFDGKTVLDLGCGFGDLLWRAWAAGAREGSIGIDVSSSIISHHVEKYIESKSGPHFRKISAKEYTNIPFVQTRQFDVIFCFSVLSYLTDPTATLHWIREHSTQALIECQLAGDGPGLDWLKGPDDLWFWLEMAGWQSVKRIGETIVKNREAKRGIWLCQQ